MKDVLRLDAGLFLLRLDLPGEIHRFDSLRASCSLRRQDRANRYSKDDDRLRCLAAGWLVSHAVEQMMGVSRVEEDHDARGKPFLPQFPDIAVSISHSGPWVACILHAGSCAGIDVEMPPHMAPGMTELFMSQEELDAYQRCSSADEQRLFFQRIWCLKESWLKAVGTGMLQDPTKVTIRAGNSEMIVCGKSNELWYTYEKWLDDGALLTACWQ